MFSLPTPLCRLTMEQKKLIVDGLAVSRSRREDSEEDERMCWRRQFFLDALASLDFKLSVSK